MIYSVRMQQHFKSFSVTLHRRFFTDIFWEVDMYTFVAVLCLAVTEAVIILDGAKIGRRFDGHGGLSAGASSRLLFDYPEPARSDILDYLCAYTVHALNGSSFLLNGRSCPVVCLNGRFIATIAHRTRFFHMTRFKIILKPTVAHMDVQCITLHQVRHPTYNYQIHR